LGSIDADAFNAFEAAGWQEKAAGYEDFFAPITARVVEPLLDAAGVGEGTRLLDVATGPGVVAGAAARRGAAVVGVDIAPAMLALARRRFPGLDFREADAERLPFPDAAFEAVVANFLVLHLGRPEQVAAELARVLAPGGKVALTVWDAPGRARLFGVFLDAVAAAGAAPPADLPAGPDFFRFAEDAEFEAILRDRGLEDAAVETIAFDQRVASADELWDGLLGGAVRTPALILRQPEETQRRIREAFEEQLAAHRDEDAFKLPLSVKLASATKPASAPTASR
jgi:SAM-dependent methyltransferase